MSRRAIRKTLKVEVPRQPIMVRAVRLILRLPRLLRILLIALFALAVTFAISPAIDAIYLQFFFSETTRVLPSLAAAAAGLVMYALGWLLVVGTVDEALPERMIILWYISLGLLAVALVIVMLVNGWMSGNVPIN